MLSFFKKNKPEVTTENEQLLEKLGEVKDIIPATDVLRFFGKLTDAYSEYQITTRELAKIQAQKEILLTEIHMKYDLYHTVFNRIFDERQTAINKSFEIIDRGLESGDRELISMGLQSLSKVVSSSPFANLQQLSGMLERNQTIEI